MDPHEQLQELWTAFPAKYLNREGVVTLGGQVSMRHGGLGVVWAFPDRGIIVTRGSHEFEVARDAFGLLPNPASALTMMVLRVELAVRVSLPYRRGVSWSTKVRGKQIEGWNLSGVGSARKFFPLPDIHDPEEAMVRALARTACTCGSDRENCPQHGSGQWWR